MIHEEDVRMMTDDHLSSTLWQFGIKVGPITGSTRLVYERKLARLLADVYPVITTPASEFHPLSNSTEHHYCTTMIPDVKAMSNEELITALKNSGARVGPITDTTRLVYERKLVRLLQDLPPATSTDELEESDNEEEETVSWSTVEEKTSERLTSAYQRFTSPLASKISSANPSTSTPSYIGTPGSSQLNTSLTRRPLSSMREEVKFTSLRNSEATPASAAPKKGVSIMVKLLVLIVFGVIAWLIYINFESAHTKPLLTQNQ